MESNNQTFVAPVVYVQSEFKELKRRFSIYVDQDYKDRCFEPIDCCKDMSKESREVTFEYVRMSPVASTKEVLVEMDCKGLRPAVYEELICFTKKYSNEQLKYPIVALGSETNVHGFRCVACLWSSEGSRDMRLRWLEGDWGGLTQFLAVRE